MSDANPLELGDELMLFSIMFGDEGVEIDFLDPRRQAQGLNEVTKLGVSRSLMRDEIEAIEEAVRDLVDEALRSRRK